MIKLILFTTLLIEGGATNKRQCGDSAIISRPYGVVASKVDCQFLDVNKIWVNEFMGKTHHGLSEIYDSLWRLNHRTFYKDGVREGEALSFDTTGAIVGRMFYKKGKPAGKSESYFAPGRPSVMKTYNDTGEVEGPWKEWWPNGNLQMDNIAKGGRIVQGAEFYPDGRPRIRYRVKDDPGRRSVFAGKYIEAEGWAPNGTSTGKMRNGNGTWIFFSAKPDTVTKQYRGWRHVYKDSLMVKGEKLDSAEMAPWLR